MDKAKKYIIAGSASVASLLGLIGTAGATIVDPPTYANIINATSTAMGSSLLNDLLPWAGMFLVIGFIGIAGSALIGRIVGGVKRIFGSKGGRGGGRRRYR